MYYSWALLKLEGEMGTFFLHAVLLGDQLWRAEALSATSEASQGELVENKTHLFTSKELPMGFNQSHAGISRL